MPRAWGLTPRGIHPIMHPSAKRRFQPIARTSPATTMKITTIAQIQDIINQPLEVIANGVYNVPGWPTVAMNRASLLKWANAIGADAVGAASLAVNLLEATTLAATAKAQYRRQAQARSQKQAARFAAMLAV